MFRGAAREHCLQVALWRRCNTLRLLLQSGRCCCVIAAGQRHLA